MLSEEQKARLNPEQLAVAEKWEREREERAVIIDELGKAEKAGDTVAFKAAIDKLSATTQDRCEHDRSIWSSCAACEEIEFLLYPEFYDENGERLPEEEIEKVIDKTWNTVIEY